MDPIVDSDNLFPQLKDVEVKASRRVLFDVQGQVFGISVDMLKQVPCLLGHLSDDLRFKNKEPDGTVFINRNPKHFGEILNIIQNFNSNSLWHVPSSPREREELLQEADFYAFPPEIMESLRDKVGEKEDATKKQIEELHAQIASLKKELEVGQENLTKEVQAKNEAIALASDSSIHTTGCYISVSDISFSLRVTKDFTKILWSGYRSLEKMNVAPYNYGKPIFEMRPLGALDAHIVLWNNLKSYILCERRSENNMGTRIDLCSMGNGELLVIIETSPSRDPLHYHSSSPPSSSPSSSSSGSASPPSSHHSSHHSHSHSHSVNIPASPSKSQPSLEERFAIATNLNRHSVPGFQRITCRFQPDPK